MRLSRYFLPVLKEAPADAQIVSHQLMLRAGMIKQNGAGIYSWLPLGMRVLHKIEKIVTRVYSAVPNTDSQMKVGVWDTSATPVLYTSAIQVLSVNHSATNAAKQYEWTPGGEPIPFALKPYDLVLDTGTTTLVGFVQSHNACNSTFFMHEPVVYFKCASQYRQ